MKNQRRLLAVLMFALILSGAGSVELHAQGLGTDAEHARAETQKLIAEKNKLDAERDYYRRTPWINLGQNLVGLAAVVITIFIGLRQLQEQRSAQVIRAKVDASIKAAEIAMSAPTTGQVRSRAKILAVLLEDFVPDFGKKLSGLDFTKIGYASYRARFTTLLEAIASHPEKALLIAESYNVLFPDDDKATDGRISKLIQRLRAQ